MRAGPDNCGIAQVTVRVKKNTAAADQTTERPKLNASASGDEDLAAAPFCLTEAAKPRYKGDAVGSRRTAALQARGQPFNITPSLHAPPLQRSCGHDQLIILQ